MKSDMRFFLLLAVLVCTASLTACLPEESAFDPRIPQMTEEEMNAPLGEGGKGMTPRRIKEISDKALRKEYGIKDVSSYRFDAELSAYTGHYYAEYTLYIQGYRTDEEYAIELDAKGKVVSVDARHRGEYSRYLKSATEESMAAAVADIERQASKYGKSGKGSLHIDEGDLCLCLEIIVNVPYSEDVPCGDHEHVFFHSRICGPDQ